MIPTSLIRRLWTISSLLSLSSLSPPEEAKAFSFSLLKNEVKTKLKVQRLIAKRNFLNNLFNLGAGTKELESLTDRILDGSRDVVKRKATMKKIIKQRLENIDKEIKQARKKLFRISNKRRKVMCSADDARGQYMTILQDFISSDWKKHSDNLRNKLMAIRNQHNTASDVCEGVKITDDELNDFAREINYVEKTTFATFGTVNLDRDELNFLRIPMKLRTIEKIDIEDVRLELDKVAAKLRYGLMSKDDSEEATEKVDDNQLPFDRQANTI